MEGGAGKANAKVHVQLLLDVREGGVAEEVMDVLQLVRTKMSELWERLEGMGAIAARRDFCFMMADF